ncbi:MAG: hypothetical protein J6Q39_07945 [Bacteroidales bacterium]|nr:hypothetical protein [Bacteroidales bacterium]
MTRREEIQWEAGGIVNRMIERGVSQCYDTYYLAFQEGAKWADKTMVEKVCDWMKEQVYQEYGGGPLERLIPDTRIEEFRKAMLE